MKEKLKEKEKLTIPEAAAEPKDGIDAEKNAETGNLQPGENKDSFDAESEKEKNAEFEELISGKFKNQFAQRVQKIIDRRFKEVKRLKENLEKNEARYENIIKRLIAENVYLKGMKENNERDEKARERAQKLRKGAEETKKEYSEFDFKEQLKNPEFVRLINAGVSVKNAYEVANIDVLLENNAKNAEKKIVDSIRSKGVRPVENGSRSTSGMVFENNISRLSKKDRKEIAKRAARGEKISF